MNGFMINSNDIGYKIIEKFKFKKYATECHYSIPYTINILQWLMNLV